MKHIVSVVLLITYATFTSSARAEDELSLLKTQLLDLLNRVEALEAENASLRSGLKVVQADHKEGPSKKRSRAWTDTINLKGDLRYRYETIDIEDRDDRERHRVRARLALTAKPTDNLELGVGIATGGDSPVSTNQTLGDAASTKDLRLDLAYFKWQVSPDVAFIGGKYKNIWRRPGGVGLVWDGDVRTEGLALTYANGNFFLDTGVNFLESDSKGSEQIAYGVQTGFNGKVGAGKLMTGVSYYYLGVEGRETFYGDPDDFFGNSFTCADLDTLNDCTYNSNFEQLELFAEWKTTVNGRPLALFADYVQNQDADDLDTGWMTGFKYGKASSKGSWEIGYFYQDLEADAVFAAWTDSNVGGGGSDVKGHVLSGAIAPMKNWTIGFKYFDNNSGVDLGSDADYRRLQLDSKFKF